LYAENANPIVSLMAQESIRALGSALPKMVSDSADEAARSEALYGAWLAGLCLGSVGMAIHHKICHTLGGSFDLPHADVHCLMIPYSSAYNREAAPEAMRLAAAALDAGDAPGALYGLSQKVGVKKSLAELGMAPADLDRAAEIAVENPYYNPRPVTREGVREMLQAAYEGRPP
ncbi:MAG TPA: iron-containing alcohol dehydrogenase, partial [Kiloniellaceae bacterium]|nr:iron-containing alcohol dehydrogenase [Kiloniellaceae bacterium]